MKSKILLILLSLFAGILFQGCEKKGAMQKAGEQVDKTIDNVQDKADDVGKDIKNSLKE